MENYAHFEVFILSVCVTAPLAFYAAPSCASSKTKGPNITQPVYATTTRDTTPYAAGGHPVDSVYSLAAKSEYMRYNVLQNTAGVPTSTPSSDDVLTKPYRSSVTSSVGGDVERNSLSEMAFFSPRPGDGLSFLAEGDPLSKTTTSYDVTSGHRAVSKSRSTTLAPNLPRGTSDRLEYRAQTNAAAYGGRYQDPQGRLQFSNGGMTSSTLGGGMPSSAGLSHISESSFDPLPATLDRDSAAREEGYGVLHMPPPIDRANKPPQQLPPAISRGLKPAGQQVDKDSSDSSEEGTPGQERLPAYTKLTEEGASEEVVKEEHETQFNVAEMPRVTVRTTHYTQVHFDPSTRRPVPLPRKTASLPHMASKSTTQRFNYTDVDIVATSQLSDHLHRQMTVREAERKALAEKHYVNIDRSGLVDDETDPDYYTHMRVSIYY